jgi:hypothetical protein
VNCFYHHGSSEPNAEVGLDISAGEEGDVFHVDWIHWDAADVDFLLAYLWTVQLCVAFTASFYYEQESDGSIDEEAEEDRRAF